MKRHDKENCLEVKDYPLVVPYKKTVSTHFLTKNVEKPLSIPELDSYRDSSDFVERCLAASYGRSEDLDKLVYDPHPAVRLEVLVHGRLDDINILIHDTDATVLQFLIQYYQRIEDFERYINHPDKEVRKYVAIYGREKDRIKLAEDPEEIVRLAVAKHGDYRCMRILVNDNCSNIREIVASRCTTELLRILVNDSDQNVQATARRRAPISWKTNTTGYMIPKRVR